MEVLVAILAAGAVFLFAAYAIRARTLRPAEARLRALPVEGTPAAVENPDGSVTLLRQAPTSPISRFLSSNNYAARWQMDLDRADIKLRPNEYFMIRLGLAVATVALFTVIGRSGIVFLISLPLSFIVYMLPAYWVNFRIRRRREKINKQLVEALTQMTNGLRAGFAFTQAMDVAARQVGPPIGDELGRVLLDINLGKTTEDALLAMNERLQSEDVDMLVTAILIQRQSGGNLAEVLENVAETIRERERITGEIRTMTSQQRLSGWVLSLWPVGLGLFLAAVNPGLMKLFFTMTLGNILLAVWVILWLIGVFAIRRILDIDW